MTKDEKSRGAKEGATADTPAAKKSTDKDTKRASNGSMQKVTKGGETGSSDARYVVHFFMFCLLLVASK